jgi:hypothetical protein
MRKPEQLPNLYRFLPTESLIDAIRTGYSEAERYLDFVKLMLVELDRRNGIVYVEDSDCITTVLQ